MQMERQRGRVVLLMEPKKCGFIQSDDDSEDLFFHVTGLKNARFDELAVGTVVTFVEVGNAKGRRAEDIEVER